MCPQVIVFVISDGEIYFLCSSTKYEKSVRKVCENCARSIREQTFSLVCLDESYHSSILSAVRPLNENTIVQPDSAFTAQIQIIDLITALSPCSQGCLWLYVYLDVAAPHV